MSRLLRNLGRVEGRRRHGAEEVVPEVGAEKFYQALQKTLPLLHHETSALHLRRRHCRSAMELFST